jgi:hypothetical protein
MWFQHTYRNSVQRNLRIPLLQLVTINLFERHTTFPQSRHSFPSPRVALARQPQDPGLMKQSWLRKSKKVHPKLK